MTNKIVEEAPYQPGYEDAVFQPEIQKPQLFVATPMYGGLCNGQYTVGMINMVSVFTMAKVPFEYSYMMNESLITRGRNSLADTFLHTNCTHLMFIDADIGFDPVDILKMIDADKDIICGLYPRKEIDWMQVRNAVLNNVPPQELHKYTGSFVVNAVGDADTVRGTLDTPVEISNGGTGFMLIKREVFEKLASVVPEYANDMYAVIEENKTPRTIKEFFATSIDAESGNRLLSEDYHFCKIARKAGFKVWGAPWAKLTHCGSYNFSGQLTRI
jgi:hypothetical protein